MSAQFDDTDLHAYVDRELDSVRAGEIEAAMSQDVALAARISTYRQDRERLKAAYGSIAERPLPPEWEERIRSSAAQGTNWRMLGAIAAALLVMVGGFGWYVSNTHPVNPDVVTAALDARSEATTPEKAFPASRDLRPFDAMLRNVVAADVKVPDLAALGYQPDAIRVYRGAIEILYRNRRQQVFSLYLKRSDGTARFDQFARANLRVCIWQDDRVSMVMAGNISAAEMQRLASLAYMGLSA